MSGGLTDLRNYNVSFKVFLKAIREYSGYIYGLDAGLFKKYLTPQGEDENAEEDREKIEEENDVRDIISQVLDRTVGAHTVFGLNGLLAPRDIENKGGIVNRSDIIVSVYNGKDANVSNITINELASPPPVDENDSRKPVNGETISIYDVVKSAFPSSTVAGEGTNEPTPWAKEELKLNSLGKSEDIDRFAAPTLSAHVIRKSQHGVSGRQAQHLPIFFSAIPAIEMSRCVPFLDIKFVHKSKNPDDDKSSGPKMSATRLFRFNPSKTFDRVQPNGLTQTDIDEFAGANFSYMDLFTSPQIAVNADINSENNSFSSIWENANPFDDEDEVGSIEDLRVLDPFQPFLSFLSLDMTEQGKHGGFLATREGQLKIKLHDKSRLRDFTPMLALDEYSFNYFVIEMGWSHPEGKLTSNNTIGQYLDNLRTINSYNITGVNYSFGNDNSVDITLNLVTRGAKSVVPKVSAFSGRHSNLSVFHGLINDTIASHEKTKNIEDKKVRTNKEIREFIRVETGNLSSLSRLVRFEDMVTVRNLSKEKKVVEGDSFYDKLGEALGVNLGDGTTDDKADKFAIAENVYSDKILWTKKTIDPFEAATRFEDEKTTAMWRGESGAAPHDSLKPYFVKDENDDVQGTHVTLGKLLTRFVAFPLSTCGVYDEVQIYFYPVNHHAAGARRHTTASIPIEMSIVENELDKIFQQRGEDEPNYAMSVEGFVKLCQRILRRKEITAYRLSPESNPASATYTQYNTVSQAFKSLSRSEKITFLQGKTALDIDGDDGDEEIAASEIPAIFSKIGYAPYADDGTTEENEKKAKEQKAIVEFLEKLSENLKENLTALLSNMYDSDGDNYDGVNLAALGPIFTPVNLEVFFETCPVVDDKKDTQLEDAISSFKSLRDAFDESNPQNSDGLIVDKNILKIHVHDSNAITHPDVAVLGLGTSSDGVVLNSKNLAESSAKLVESAAKTKNNFNWWKSIIASKYPTIIHGSANSTVKDINISSNISGDLKKIKIIEAYEKRFNRQFAEEINDVFDETQFFPSSVVIQMMGMPSINRGASIFVDLGTRTSLDNIYNVASVTHTIQPGDFTTTINCLASNQNIVSSTRSTFIEKIKKAKEEG